jgi:thioesterase domain-containing protein/acyl carrier protein
LEKELLPKSSLGKLSRTKIRTAFESGVYDPYKHLNDIIIQDHRSRSRQSPSNEIETTILRVFAEMFEVDEEEVGVNTSLYDMGASSIELIRFKQAVQAALDIKEDIPVITVLTNPTIRGLAGALQAQTSGTQEYTPAICLQSEGSGKPLWLIHPGVGEVLVFLNLAKFITDRPVYAIRARGFNKGETFFEDIPEAVTTYHAAIKKIQPEGPYAIAGYSYGSMLAFEITKVLEKQGDTVGFLGVLNLPPHIKFRMRQLDWTEVILSLSYFLDLMTEEYAHSISPAMHLLTRDQVMDRILSEAPPQRLKEMILDRQKLMKWADLAYQMQAIAQDYDPSGIVNSMDVFYAVPLSAVAKNKEEWLSRHLNKWIGFVDEAPRFHEVDGAHYTMINPEHVLSFSKKLKAALRDRGL